MARRVQVMWICRNIGRQTVTLACCFIGLDLSGLCVLSCPTDADETCHTLSAIAMLYSTGVEIHSANLTSMHWHGRLPLRAAPYAMCSQSESHRIGAKIAFIAVLRALDRIIRTKIQWKNPCLFLFLPSSSSSSS